MDQRHDATYPEHRARGGRRTSCGDHKPQATGSGAGPTSSPRSGAGSPGAGPAPPSRPGARRCWFGGWDRARDRRRARSHRTSRVHGVGSFQAHRAAAAAGRGSSAPDRAARVAATDLRPRDRAGTRSGIARRVPEPEPFAAGCRFSRAERSRRFFNVVYCPQAGGTVTGGTPWPAAAPVQRFASSRSSAR
jgi:hypothetical protein